MFVGADASAAVTCVPVTEVPAEVTALQAVVTHCAHPESGMPLTTPALDQLEGARVELMMPDVLWQKAGTEKNSNKIRLFRALL